MITYWCASSRSTIQFSIQYLCYQPMFLLMTSVNNIIMSFDFSRFTVGPIHVATVPGVRHVFRVVGVLPAQRTGHGRTQVVVR